MLATFLALVVLEYLKIEFLKIECLSARIRLPYMCSKSSLLSTSLPVNDIFSKSESDSRSSELLVLLFSFRLLTLALLKLRLLFIFLIWLESNDEFGLTDSRLSAGELK